MLTSKFEWFDSQTVPVRQSGLMILYMSVNSRRPKEDGQKIFFINSYPTAMKKRGEIIQNHRRNDDMISYRFMMNKSKECERRWPYMNDGMLGFDTYKNNRVNNYNMGKPKGTRILLLNAYQ